MNVAIIDYGSGNLRSAAKAFERAIAEAGLGMSVQVTNDPGVVGEASHIVLPGVGAFGDCKCGLEAVSGMTDILQRSVIQQARPFMGICVGMQLMASVGREHGDHTGFDWIPGQVVPITPDDAALKIPHMGWNELQPVAPHPLLNGIEAGAHVYFVHSYQLVPENPAHLMASVDYGGPVTAMVGRDNMVGTQFHPEKSQVTGLKLITNFLNWRP